MLSHAHWCQPVEPKPVMELLEAPSLHWSAVAIVVMLKKILDCVWEMMKSYKIAENSLLSLNNSLRFFLLQVTVQFNYCSVTSANQYKFDKNNRRLHRDSVSPKVFRQFCHNVWNIDQFPKFYHWHTQRVQCSDHHMNIPDDQFWWAKLQQKPTLSRPLDDDSTPPCEALSVIWIKTTDAQHIHMHAALHCFDNVQ